jgi:hypothetical protein
VHLKLSWITKLHTSAPLQGIQISSPHKTSSKVKHYSHALKTIWLNTSWENIVASLHISLSWTTPYGREERFFVNTSDMDIKTGRNPDILEYTSFLLLDDKCWCNRRLGEIIWENTSWATLLNYLFTSNFFFENIWVSPSGKGWKIFAKYYWHGHVVTILGIMWVVILMCWGVHMNLLGACQILVLWHHLKT